MTKLRQLFHYEQTSGLQMIAAIVLALLAANSPLAPVYQLVHDTQIHFRFGPLVLEGPLVHWIYQGLMVIFFLIAGLEIKRQFLEGHLSTPRRAILPAFAAVGGIVAPAAIYAGINWGGAAALDGWAILTATDIVWPSVCWPCSDRGYPRVSKSF